MTLTSSFAYSSTAVLSSPSTVRLLRLSAHDFVPDRRLLGTDTVILNLVGIQGATKQTGIGAGLNMMAFAMQFIGAIHLKTIRRRTMVLWTWPFLMVSMAGIAASGAVFANSGQLDRAAGIASYVPSLSLQRLESKSERLTSFSWAG